MPLFQQDFKPTIMPEAVNPLHQALSEAIAQYGNIAKARQENAKANLPFGGANVPGAAGKLVGLEMVKGLYGEDSPQYKQAKQAYDLDLQSTGSRINYQDKLSGSLPLRYTTNTGRQMIEGSNVAQGYSPTGTAPGEPATPGAPAYQPSQTPEAAADQYNLELQKKRSDAGTRQKTLYAQNVEKTVGQINPDDLVRYSGPMGMVKKGIEAGKALTGNASEEFLRHSEAVRAVDLLTKQVRQFYGDSIQPSVQEDLKKLGNPSTWNTSPQVAKRLYQKYIDILGKETGTYTQALQTPKAYQSNNKNSSLTIGTPDQLQGQQPPPGTFWMIRPDGMQVAVHPANIDQANIFNYKAVE